MAFLKFNYDFLKCSLLPLRQIFFIYLPFTVSSFEINYKSLLVMRNVSNLIQCSNNKCFWTFTKQCCLYLASIHITFKRRNHKMLTILHLKKISTKNIISVVH